LGANFINTLDTYGASEEVVGGGVSLYVVKSNNKKWLKENEGGYTLSIGLIM
jgi:hypothetical protein